MILAVKIEDGRMVEVHPVACGMLCDGMSTINPRLLARMAELVMRVRASGKCETLTVSFHPYGCGHEVIP